VSLGRVAIATQIPYDSNTQYIKRSGLVWGKKKKNKKGEVTIQGPSSDFMSGIFWDLIKNNKFVSF
jgi:hypothetical protein